MPSGLAHRGADRRDARLAQGLADFRPGQASQIQLRSGDCLGRSLGLQQARGLVDWQALAGACERAARDLRLAANGTLRDLRGSVKLRWNERSEQPAFLEARAALAVACGAAAAGLLSVAETGPDFGKLHERATALSGLAAAFQRGAAEGHVRWIDVSPHQARLVESPLDIRDMLSEQRARAPKAWIFTSATLGDDDALSWFTATTGLEDAVKLRLGRSEDPAITIRTMVFDDDEYSFQAGAGIVSDSVPETEYQEVLAKSAILRHALELAEEGL